MGSRKKKKRKTGRKPVPAPSRPRFSLIWIISIVLGLAIASSFITYTLRQTDTGPATPSATGEPKTRISGDFDKLIGRWRRTDGGYIIEVRGIDANGRMDAAYYNPAQINEYGVTFSVGRELEQVLMSIGVNYVFGSGDSFGYTIDPDTQEVVRAVTTAKESQLYLFFNASYMF